MGGWGDGTTRRWWFDVRVMRTVVVSDQSIKSIRGRFDPADLFSIRFMQINRTNWISKRTNPFLWIRYCAIGGNVTGPVLETFGNELFIGGEWQRQLFYFSTYFLLVSPGLYFVLEITRIEVGKTTLWWVKYYYKAHRHACVPGKTT